MKILLDECLPAGLRRDLAGHEVHTVPQMGWSGLQNGNLLTQAVAGAFEVFVTVDKNLPKQQKIAAYPVAVIVMRCPTNDIIDLRKLVPELLGKLSSAPKGQAMFVG